MPRRESTTGSEAFDVPRGDGLVAGIRWLDLTPLELCQIERNLSAWDIYSLDPQSWRAHQAAKARPEIEVGR